MKRFLFVISALLVTIVANAQMQRNFLGLQLGKQYLYSLCHFEVEKHCKSLGLVEDKRIVAYEVNFGGYDWGMALLDFKGQNRILHSVSFVKSEYDMQTLMYIVESLKTQLISKYGRPTKESNDFDTFSTYWDFKNCQERCQMTISRMINSAGQSVYTLILMYMDGAVNQVGSDQL